MKKRVMDLAGWVPQPGGAKSDRVPSADEVFIERVLKVFDDHIMFSCRFVDWPTGEAVARSIFYDFPVLDENLNFSQFIFIKPKTVALGADIDHHTRAVIIIVRSRIFGANRAGNRCVGFGFWDSSVSFFQCFLDQSWREVVMTSF